MQDLGDPQARLSDFSSLLQLSMGTGRLSPSPVTSQWLEREQHSEPSRQC